MSEKACSLLILGQRLRSLCPPSLSVLISRLEEAEEYEIFLSLVKEFLPEREQEILSETTPVAQIAAFASRFEDRYFPLDSNLKGGFAEGYGELVYRIPVIPLGFSYENYDEIPADYRPGLQLMTYFIESPHGDNGGMRVALSEACREHVPVELLQQIPQGGLSVVEAHRLFDGTPYSGLATWADTLFANTGNFFLDTDEELLCSGGAVEWTREMVEDLARQWRQAEVLQNATIGLADRLEADPETKVRELLDFIEKRKRELADGDSHERKTE